jgi:hypothetical protein
VTCFDGCGNIGIAKRIDNEHWWSAVYCGPTGKLMLPATGNTCGAHPLKGSKLATSEQRGLLFKAIEECGHVFDEEQIKVIKK